MTPFRVSLSRTASVLGFMGFPLGIIAALIAWVIELKLLLNLFQHNHWLIPFTLATILEATKIFYLFKNRYFEITEDDQYLKDRHKYFLLYLLLVVFSGVCTLFLTVNNLKNPESGKVIEQKVADLQAERDSMKARVNQHFHREIQPQKKEVERIRKLKEERRHYNIDGDPHNDYKFTNVKASYEKAQTKLRNLKARADKQRMQALDSIDQWYNEQLPIVKKQARQSFQAQNEYLVKTISVFAERNEGFRFVYKLLIILIALFVATVIELIIYYCFNVIAIDMGLVHEYELNEENRDYINNREAEREQEHHDQFMANVRNRFEDFRNQLNNVL